MSLYETIGERIKKARIEEGLSQEQLAKKIGETANTISRWESATYKPTIDDLERISRVLKHVAITDFLPPDLVPKDRAVKALLRTAQGLEKTDLDELRRFADWLVGKNALAGAKSPKKGRSKD